MSHFPSVYAKLLEEKMEKTNARCILLNTGWSGGPASSSPRISIKDTRALLSAGLSGELHNGTETEMHPVFNLRVPKTCPGVDSAVLNPRNVWADKSAYDASANKLRDLFRANFDNKGFGDLGVDAVM